MTQLDAGCDALAEGAEAVADGPAQPLQGREAGRPRAGVAMRSRSRGWQLIDAFGADGAVVLSVPRMVDRCGPAAASPWTRSEGEAVRLPVSAAGGQKGGHQPVDLRLQQVAGHGQVAELAREAGDFGITVIGWPALQRRLVA